MKPTPCKVVLLMSAAGLGLSWSGLALAARDHDAPAGPALSFGASRSQGSDCNPQHPTEWASCPAVDGDLLRTITLRTASLPLPWMPQATPVGGANVSFGAVSVAPASQPSEEAWPDEGDSEPSDRAPHPDAPVAARSTDDPNRDREAEAIAMVLLDDPRDIADATASGAEQAALLAATAARAPDDTAGVVAATVSLQVQTTAEPDGAAAGERLTPDEEVAVERVLASLAEVLGSQLDEQAAASNTQTVQAAAPVKETVTVLGAPVASVDVVAAPPPVAALRAQETVHVASLHRSSEADDIVVASSHNDKILMSLAALRSADGTAADLQGAQTKKTVVLRHADKVLETLALFQSKKPAQDDLACYAGSAATEEIGIGAVPDILLDLEPPVAAADEQPSVQTVTQQATQPAPVPVARAERNPIGAELVALGADKLDEVRGGFVTDGGLKISFGIERAVYLNGTLVTTTSLNIADLAKISGGQAQVSGSGTPASLAVLQSGAGNVFAPGSISSTAAGTVIQNTLDNQKINTITRIDAVVNSTGIMRSMSLQSSMQSAIVNSLRR